MKTKATTGVLYEVRCSASHVGRLVLHVRDANGSDREYPMDTDTAIRVAGMLLSRAMKGKPKTFR